MNNDRMGFVRLEEKPHHSMHANHDLHPFKLPHEREQTFVSGLALVSDIPMATSAPSSVRVDRPLPLLNMWALSKDLLHDVSPFDCVCGSMRQGSLTLDSPRRRVI